jgi:photosystem II stability/assembly factor-like uncharacterized protein
MKRCIADVELLPPLKKGGWGGFPGADPLQTAFAVAAWLFLLSAALMPPALAAAQPAAPVEQQPAVKRSYATEEMLLAATRAGKRLVVVGDHGVVLLSDDDGMSFRQARAVPTRATLTSVSFVDARNGWAVGHWGVILHTSDGGEAWVLQRSDTSVDRPLFSVHFTDAGHGLAVGLWSLVLATRDGGKTWSEVTVPAPPEGGRADRNLMAIFANSKGTIFVAAERGTVLRSDDQGATWTYLNTGYKGSFWTGCALKDDTLIVAGLRGTIYRSTDDGRTWQAVASGTKSSITHIAEVGDRVVAVGLDGVQLQSTDRGASFTGSQREDNLSLTAFAVSGGRIQAYSKHGIVAGAAGSGTN